MIFLAPAHSATYAEIILFRIFFIGFNRLIRVPNLLEFMQPTLAKLNRHQIAAFLKPGGFASLQNLCEKGIQGLRRSPILLKHPTDHRLESLLINHLAVAVMFIACCQVKAFNMLNISPSARNEKTAAFATEFFLHVCF